MAEITVVNPEILCVAYDDFDKLVEKVKEKVAAVGGDVASTIASAFTESKDPYPIPQAGESIKVILGKVVKFFNDVKTGCCKIGDIVNNCTSTDTDKPLAAAVGKVLWDKIVDAVAALGTHKSSADHDGRYYTEMEMDTKLGGKANSSHTHDDRYYTESEMNTKLDGKSNTNHGHSGMLVTGDVIDNCTSTATNKPLSAKQGKTLWDKIANAVSALATHKSSADHDGRYYTESEINTKLGGKSDTSHNHDSSYVKKHTVAEVSGIQVGKKETNGYGWIDIYYKGVHEFSIYVENSGTGLIIKPALPLSTRHQYVNVLCQLQQKGNLVVDSGRIVDNCTSDVTYNVLSANQGRILMNKYNQLNSEKLAISKLFKQLWNGTWTSGSLTISGISDYKLFMVVSSGYPIVLLGALLWDTVHCQGIDLASGWSQRNFVAKFNISGNTVKNLETSVVNLGYNGGVSAKETFPITHIIGII